MTYPKNISRTAILLVAVLFISIITGCVTKRDIEEVKREIATVKQQNQETQDMVARMDSIITAGAEASDALRGELRFSVGEMSGQIQQLLDNYTELMEILNELLKKKSDVIVLPPKNSPGAQADQPTTGPTTTPIEPQKPAYNCDSVYDTSFLLVRQGEYEKAISGFTAFLENCSDHQNVENAHYWTGESLYAQEKYAQAIDVFNLLLKDFPGSLRTAAAMYKLGRSQQELGKVDEAKATYKKLADDYPNEMEGRQAKERLKDLEG